MSPPRRSQPTGPNPGRFWFICAIVFNGLYLYTRTCPLFESKFPDPSLYIAPIATTVPSADIDIDVQDPNKSPAASPSISSPNIRQILPYVGVTKPALVGGASIECPRVVAGSVVAENPVATEVRMGVHTRPFVE